MIDRAGWPFVIGGAVPAVVAALSGWPGLGVALLALPLLLGLFFRDPERTPPPDGEQAVLPEREQTVLSPADGRVLVAGPAEPELAPPGRWLQVSIFLSLLDVHVNRVPVSGTVTTVEFRPGRFLPAYRKDSGRRNERSEVWVDVAGRPVVFRQVVGVLARRVVCRIAAGDQVVAGQRFGVMKFGSRMDVFLPEAGQLCVSVGDRVHGGSTVLAILPPQSSGPV